MSPDRKVELLTDSAEGLKFALTDGVDVAADGTIYFTDASYKYNLDNHMADVLEARPHGRLMSFDPSTRRTSHGIYSRIEVSVVNSVKKRFRFLSWLVTGDRMSCIIIQKLKVIVIRRPRITGENTFLTITVGKPCKTY